MKRLYFIFTCVISLTCWISLSHAIEFGLGTLHVGSAATIAKKGLNIGTHSHAFFKDEMNQFSDGTSKGETYWDVQGRLGVVYGFTEKLELGLSYIMYQDNHKGGDGYNFPDNLLLRVKLGSLGPQTSSMRFGLQGNFRFPTTNKYNLPLEPYSADRIGVGLTGLFSILSDPLYPEYGFNLHANLGFFNHNDVGLTMTDVPTDTITATDNTKELLYGISAAKKIQHFNLYAEIYGSTFLTEPPITAYTRESSLYFSPGITYQSSRTMSFNVALDLRLIGNDDKTVYSGSQGSILKKPWKDVPNLPSWRINIGATFAIRRGLDNKYSINEYQQNIPQAESSQVDQDIYMNLAKEREKTENAEAELERIRSERQRMEDLLKRLRGLLDPEKTAPPKQENNQE